MHDAYGPVVVAAPSFWLRHRKKLAMPMIVYIISCIMITIILTYFLLLCAMILPY
jgi:hypothetical protein